MVGPGEVEAYASMDNEAPNRAFVERLFELGARGRMLDLGTGPGHIPLLVCERDPQAHVTAIDLSEAMIAEARRLRAASPHRARLVFEVGDAKVLAYPDGGFDAVFSNTLLHHLPEAEPFLRDARRVLRPGGALLVRDLFRPETPEQADALVTRHAGDASPAQRRLFRDSLCAALTPSELRRAADQAGLTGAELVIDSDRHMSLQLRARD